MLASGMTLGRLMDYNVLYFLREIVLIRNRYYTINNNESLSVVAGTSNLQWKAINDRWVYYNPDSTILTNLNVVPTITHDGTLNYIDYLNGIVHFSAAPTSVTASYSAQLVNVIDGFPTFERFEELTLPLVAVEMGSKPRKPLAIGGGHFVTYNFTIHIWANNNGERDDLTERLEEGIQTKLRLNNYNNGFPLSTKTADYGSINTSFDRSSIHARAQVIDVSTQPVTIPTNVEKERFRSEISAKLEIARATVGVN